ncbi:MAG: hypothetical protein QG552_3302 [Thermodesulfobacteriota bacterium]|nr:hypothetical protein [Thermodesulfobacteriota bacterium]
MKLSTRSRYGTRMVADLTEHYDQGPVRIGDISRRQNISVKYLEQLLIPLKKAGYIISVRGPKGGHILARSPENISVGEIVRVLEGNMDLIECAGNPECCDRIETCLTRGLWEEAAKAMMGKLDEITLASLIVRKRGRVEF